MQKHHRFSLLNELLDMLYKTEPSDTEMEEFLQKVRDLFILLPQWWGPNSQLRYYFRFYVTMLSSTMPTIS
jgi:hypothetical protein